MSDNITAALHYKVGEVMDEAGIDSLNAVLTTLRKHGLHPLYYEFEADRDAAPVETGALPEIVSEFPTQDVIEEQRRTHYDSTTNRTTVTITQTIKGEIKY